VSLTFGQPQRRLHRGLILRRRKGEWSRHKRQPQPGWGGAEEEGGQEALSIFRRYIKCVK